MKNTTMPAREGGRSTRGTLQMLTICAMLVAMEIVLNRFLSINTAGWKIGFAFIPPMVAAMLYGPAMSACIYALSDVLGALLFPIGPYHPGFTASAALMGIVCGVFLHTQPLLIFGSRAKWRSIKLFPNYLAVVTVNCILLGLFINTLWVSQLYGSKTYWGWFLYRLPEYAVMVPIQIAIMPILRKVCDMLRLDGVVRVPGER